MMKYVLFTIAITLVSANVMAEMQDDDSAWAWNTEQDKDIQSQLVADVSLTGSLANTGSLTGSLANTGSLTGSLANTGLVDVEDASRTTGSLSGSLANTGS